MAQQKPNTQKVDEQAQSDGSLENINPQMLTSEMTKAFQELAQSVSPPLCSYSLPGPLVDNVYRGERTASALESKLDGIHRNLDRLLASFEEMGQSRAENKPSGPGRSN
ncbi:hypothetical protein PV04_00197 [Phialophora macrospora]|uniref:Uncharacterized protein n=1 Tax=Phialophora macrospora TaxID=1851006 RepID=A0A0D2ECI6_9EURO|nr:hypothetical protein PV04_00197 [Phialophora macrospora]